jgi:hypothetical protein
VRESKLVGKIVNIKSGWGIAGGWGIVIGYDGEYYHVAPFCDSLESAQQYQANILARDEFTVRRTKKR